MVESGSGLDISETLATEPTLKSNFVLEPVDKAWRVR